MSATVVLLGLLGLLVLICALIAMILLTGDGRKSPAGSQRPRATTASPVRLDPQAVATSPARPDPRSPYERIPALLTAAERDFFAALQQAAPAGHKIFAQVRLANLVQVKPWARRDKSHWWRIQAKCLDFVLVESTAFAPRLVIELDDASHNRADRRERDAFVDDVLAAVGIPILHVRWQRRYDVRALAEVIAGRVGVAAPAPDATPGEADGFWRPIPLTPQNGVVPAMAMPAVVASAISAQMAASRHACGQCQAELRPGARFCAQCGAVFAG